MSSFSVLSFLMPTLGEPPEEAVFAPLPGDKDPLKDYADKLQLSAFIFFLIATIFAIVALICHILIVRMPYFRLTLKSAEADDDHYDDEGEENDDEGAGRDGRDSSTKGSGKKSKGHTSIFSIERKIRGFGLSVFWVFFVTLSVFPAITSSVLSVNDGPGASPILQPVLFVPLGFIVFNVGDWIGRVLPAIQMFILRSKKGLIIASLARTLFIVGVNLLAFGPIRWSRSLTISPHFCPRLAALPSLQRLANETSRHRLRYWWVHDCDDPVGRQS